MSDKQRSRKHHYLPICYLKGFTDQRAALYVYDKHLKKLWETSPEKAFNEKDLNTTILHDGSKSDWIENLYTHTDTLAAPLLKKIRACKFDQPSLDHKERLELGLFISTSFWRSPAQDELIESVIDEKGFSHGYFGVFKHGNGESVDASMTKDMLANPAFRKAYRQAMTMIPWLDMSKFPKVQDWRFYFQDPGFNITGDNPLVHRTSPGLPNILDEFIFPLSTTRLIVCSERFESRDMSPEFGVDLGLAIIHQSKRFVCSHRKDFLMTLIGHYDKFRRYWSDFDYLESLFDRRMHHNATGDKNEGHA